MKYNKLYVALSAIFALTLVSCTNEPTTPPAKERPVSKPDSVYTYNLDVNGNETLYSKTYYTYDALKNPVTTLYVLSPTYQNKTEMEYNEKGQMTVKKESRYRLNANVPKWYNYLYWKYIYDTDNKLSEVYIYNGWIDSEPVDEFPMMRCVYSWTDDTHVEYQVYSYAIRKGEAVLEQTIILSYTSFGEVEKEIFYWSLYGIREVPDFQYDYVYDQNGNCINVTCYENGTLSYKEYNKYEYDEDGMILVKWHCNNTGGDDTGAFNTKSVYYY